MAASKKFAIVRSSNAGVFFGEIKSLDTQAPSPSATLKNARRVWYWSGAASLSELAVRGPKNPSSCKFPLAVPEVILFGVCEIIPLTKAQYEKLNEVPEWKA